MGHWEFKLEFRDLVGKTSVKELLDSEWANYDYRGNERGEDAKLSNCLCDFFSDKHIQELVENDAWEEIFKCWQADYSNKFTGLGKCYGNRPGWITEYLAGFLALSGVDFWNYFPSEDKIDNRVKDLIGLYWIE